MLLLAQIYAVITILTACLFGYLSSQPDFQANVRDKTSSKKMAVRTWQFYAASVVVSLLWPAVLVAFLRGLIKAK